LEETGLDYLFLDELHRFKNKPVTTTTDGIASAG
jgi:hypothetical protein